ncbi:CYTH domain-containing protein [Tissierella creatinini]|nr:CYTH domain-containing protein [Tissierella creatinini]TJX66658.1 CYTH domain-containing protein [Soehngenia saccharolytica]
MVKELEIKVLNIDIDEIENKLKNLGARLISKELQINTLIDSSERPIKSYVDAYLRIRESKDLLNDVETTTFTMKKNLNNKVLRENAEYNTTIESKDILLQILKELGFDKVSIGHKERTSYELKGSKIDLDIWDKDTYPNPYMEIEVQDESELEKIIELLDLPRENISTKSIVELRRVLNLE